MRWVAFLRAVNVGGRSKVPMAELRALCGELDLDGVATYIQSGNVVFATGRKARGPLAQLLEQAIADRFDVRTRAILRTADELDAVVAAHPFGKDTSHSYVTFLAEPAPAAAVARVEALDTGADRVVVAGSEVYLHYPNGLGRSKTPALVDRALKVEGTNRNWRTVVKLAELARG